MDILLRSAKELIRHFFTKVGARSLFASLRSHNAIDDALLDLDTRRERFAAIYYNGVWNRNAAGIPASGEGSTIVATQSLRTELPRVLQKLDIKTLIDLGCGDFTWMKTLSLRQYYIGVDVVPSVIDANRRDFGNERRSFFCLDVVEEDIPEGDAILCREILFHLSLSDIHAVLRNCARKPRRYLFATTDNSTLVNADIRSGDYRRLNLRCRPFGFPEPDYVIDDSRVEKGRKIGIWKWERLLLIANS